MYAGAVTHPRLARAARALPAILSALAIGTACGPPTPTDDPEMNRAAAKVHDVMLVLEPAMLGAGLVTGAAPGQAPDVELDTIADVVGALFGDCITLTSGTETVALRIEFAADGCGLPDTSARVEGALTIEAAAGDSSGFALTFEQFRVGGGAPLDGAIGITFVDDSTITFFLQDLFTAPGDAIDIEGTLASSRVHTVATLTGTGEVEVDGTRYALSVTDFERHIGTDCYPEEGVISLDVPDESGGRLTTTLELDDTGLDSDDSGLAYITLGDREDVVRLPERAWCL